MLSDLTIAGNTYQSYLSVDEADVFLAVEVNRREAWAALSADDKARLLVASTRRIDFFEFKGERADPDQSTKWPRANTGDGEDLPEDAVSSGTTIPDPIEEATALLAGTIAANPAAASVSHPDASQTYLKRVKAGTAEVEFYSRNRQSAAVAANVSAQAAQELADAEAQLLLRPYILQPVAASRAEEVGSAFAFGTDQPSQSDNPCNDFTRAGPLA